MNYLVIEMHGGAEYATIVIDENGNNKYFTKKRKPKLTTVRQGLL